MEKNKTILVVDDDDDILVAAELLLKRQFGQVICCNRPDKIPMLMAAHNFDAVLLDMNFSPGESSGEQGFNWLQRILQIDSDAVVILITAHGGVNVAVEAMKHGATDFIAKPWHNEKVIATISSAIQLHDSRSEASQLKKRNQVLVEALGSSKQNLFGHSQAMVQVHSIIARSAPTDANVLVIGENGTGKELVAREIHHRSLRADQIFMSVDLGAISESLFESELFGHKKGAFTGATSDRVGRFVAANGGTLFLDEIGNIPLHLQAKLLTVLELRQVVPLGSNQPIAIDVRMIAATNASKEFLSDGQKFRQDLLFRLNTVEVLVPPLRQRSEDIAEIAIYYSQYYAKKYRKPVKRFSDEALAAAKKYNWPGNVRALRHSVERATILSEHDEIQVSDLQIQSPSEREAKAEFSATRLNSKNGMSEAMLDSDITDLNIEAMEKRFIRVALERHQNNISQAAKELGITRATLYRRIEKYDF